MFKEQLKNDIDGISPSPELLDRVSLMMNEQAAKPRRNVYIAALRFAGTAAAVCLLAFGAAKLGLFNTDNKIESRGTMAETTEEMQAAGTELYGEAGSAEITAAAAAAEESGEADIIDEAPAGDAVPQVFAMRAEEPDGETSEESLTDAEDKEKSLPEEGAQEAAADAAELLCVYSGGRMVFPEKSQRLAELCRNSVPEGMGMQLKMLLSDSDINEFMDSGTYVCLNSDGESFLILINSENSFAVHYGADGYQRLFALPEDIKAEVLEILG